MGRTIGRIFIRTFAWLAVTLVVALAGIFCAVFVILKGPSVHARDLLVMSLRETSALYWIPGLYLSPELLDEIIATNTVVYTEEEVDTGMIEIPADPAGDAADSEKEVPPIEVFEISGSSYVGDVLLIHDPSRVFIGNKGPYDGSAGNNVDKIAERYGAVAGINGGGFYDPNGQGNGGTPDGFVISEGKAAYAVGGTHLMIGLNTEHKLIISRTSLEGALGMGLRDAVCVQSIYAPVLIVNGEEQAVAGYGGGLNPRTAIGQAADGTIIFVTTDGRQANSIGATFADMVRIMSDFGAVNAASLDGGSSTSMYYEGEYLNTPYALSGPRIVPNAFLVRP
ncbi:MAG: phosphodiester glycosidase family protein [Lachnospiraceae bacterium]|nr:phosphodiester glycosidase family protein [Lachnospiraceae bacterium]